MEAVKNKLNSMKAQSELSEERISKFESNLVISKQQLQAALKEKESLNRKIEVIETHILAVERQKEDVTDRLKNIRDDTDCSESKRRVLENRELEGDVALVKLEDRLRSVREKYFENSTQYEEGDRRLAKLNIEYDKVYARRCQSEEKAKSLEKEIDAKMIHLRHQEELMMKNSHCEMKYEEHMKLLESYHQEAVEKRETGRLNILRLRRLIERAEDDLEEVQMKVKALKVELQNTIQVVVSD